MSIYISWLTYARTPNINIHTYIHTKKGEKKRTLFSFSDPVINHCDQKKLGKESIYVI